MKSTTTKILWFVYLCLLLVLLPHTAWAFESMEPEGARLTPWVAAIAFESAIAVLTHKLAKHIEGTAKIRGALKKFAARYLNAYALGLAVATLVSALANLAHSVEFGRPLAIFAQWHIPQGVYSFAFGGVLPFVSLIFARVLSNVTDDEDTPNPELTEARARLTEANKRLADSERRRTSAEEQLANTEQSLRASEDRAKIAEGKSADSERLLNTSEGHRIAAEDRARLAEERFGAIGDLVKYLFSDDKKQRIIAARQQWPQLTNSAIAVISGASPAYVSEVLNSGDLIDVTDEYAQAGK